MGTSKGYIAPTRPEWSASKRSVSTFLRNRDTDSKAKAVSKFAEAMSTGTSSASAFSSAAGNVLAFAKGLATNGLNNTLSLFGREDLIGKAPKEVPTYLNYKIHADKGSMYNTPPCWTIYVAGEVFKYLKKIGGVKVMQERNEKKAAKLYAAIDASEMFKGTVAKEDRSLMNVTFVTGDADLDKKFIAEAREEGLINLAGHRSVGGMRASIYNAMPEEGVDALIEFMKKFEAENK